MTRNVLTMVFLTVSLVASAAGQDKSGAANQGRKASPQGVLLAQEPPGLVPELFAPGIVSTGLHEHSSVVVTSDGHDMFFTVADGAQHVILHIPRGKNGWLKPRVASFSGRFTDDRPFLGPGGKRLYFTSKRPRSKGGAPEQDYGIWYTDRSDAGWSKPEFDPVLTAMDIATPGFAGNGNLYFCANKKGGRGREDLYVARWVNGAYAEPESLGDAINTEVMEAYLFIAADESYIIFSSFGRPEGNGLFISFRSDEGDWAKARFLGPVINQSDDERFAWVSQDGKYLFFNRQWEKHGAHAMSTLTLEDLHKRSAMPQNGRGDVYWVDAKILEQFRR